MADALAVVKRIRECSGDMTALVSLAMWSRRIRTEAREACAQLVEQRLAGLVDADIVGDLPETLPAAIRSEGGDPA